MLAYCLLTSVDTLLEAGLYLPALKRTFGDNYEVRIEHDIHDYDQEDNCIDDDEF